MTHPTYNLILPRAQFGKLKIMENLYDNFGVSYKNDLC